MTSPIRFVPLACRNAKENLVNFVETVRGNIVSIQPSNDFYKNAWSILDISPRRMNSTFIYFCQLDVKATNYYPKNAGKLKLAANVPDNQLMREPFRSFAKALISYEYAHEKNSDVTLRVTALRYLERALFEMNQETCPTATTPEVLNRACNLITDRAEKAHSSVLGRILAIHYKKMVELELVAVPSSWSSIISAPAQTFNRIGKEFDIARQKKLPSPLAIEAMAEIFNSDSNNPLEIFSSSICALMLCSPERSIEMLYAPRDILTPDWIDEKTGEVGTGLRWFPAKGAPPMIKTVIPSMRDIAIQAVKKLQNLSAPAQKLAQWYEENPNRIYLPAHLEYLRSYPRINQKETHAILFGGEVNKLTVKESQRVIAWLRSKNVPRVFTNRSSTVSFLDLEKAVLTQLPKGFPIMDPENGMRYSEALCLARKGEFHEKLISPEQCCFDRIKYGILHRAFKTTETNGLSVFERRGYKDKDGKYLYLTSHMLRHYLNTLVRHSGQLTEDEIAVWSGRIRVSQNAAYNHESDRDVIAKLRDAVGDPSRSVGPFSNIDNRIFVRRDEFANIKIITAHTTEFGHCIHDYAQSPCQVHQDCINCDEEVCIKGDVRAETNLRKTHLELTRLQADAKVAFSAEVLNAAEWFGYQTKTLERVNQLIAILDDPNVPHGAVIQLSGIAPPSRLLMAEEKRKLEVKSISKSITSLEEVRALLTDSNLQTKGPSDDR